MTSIISDPAIQECMNDIIDQVDAREWQRVNEWGQRMVKKHKREKEKNQNMKDDFVATAGKMFVMKNDWKAATEKQGQENYNLLNQIKKLKEQNKNLEENVKVWMKESFSNDNLKIEIEKLKQEIEELKEQ